MKTDIYVLVRESLNWEEREHIVVKLLTSNHDIRNTVIAECIKKATGCTYNKSTISRLVQRVKNKCVAILKQYYTFD